MDFVWINCRMEICFPSQTIFDVYTREAVTIRDKQSPEGRQCSTYVEQGELELCGPDGVVL